jgi:hypothetical protein
MLIKYFFNYCYFLKYYQGKFNQMNKFNNHFVFTFISLLNNYFEILTLL